MTLNLDRNKSVLVHAWKEVLDEMNPINWALFGYDGQTYDLNLVGKGDGGLQELGEDFNSGKIQYALCRVHIQDKNLHKIVLINWQGEGAPLARKGMAANHLQDIKSFFKGVHVTLNARTDEDVEPDLVVQMVSKAVAGEGVKIAPTNVDNEKDVGPVGAVYQRVNPQQEINSKVKDDFWKKDSAEEDRRRRDQVKMQRKFSQDEVKLLRKESQEYFDKEEQETALEKHHDYLQKVKSSSPSPQPHPQVHHFNGVSTANTNGNKATSPIPPTHTLVGNTAERTAALQASTPMKSNSNLVRQRIKSFDGGSGPVFPTNTTVNGGRRSSQSNSPNLSVTSSSNGIRSPSPNQTTTTPTPNENGTTLDSVLKRKQLFESGVSPNTTGTARRNPADEIRQAQEAAKKQENVKAVSRPPPQEERVISPVAHLDSTIVPTAAPPPPQQHFFTNPASVPKSPSPQPQRKSPSPQPQPTPPPQKEEIHEDTSVKSGQEGYTNSKGAPEGGDTITIQITPEMGLCARALYDYQAADETEITFDPGEIIRNIEKIDEGWWEGLAPNGHNGLFPANYVELLN